MRATTAGPPPHRRRGLPEGGISCSTSHRRGLAWSRTARRSTTDTMRRPAAGCAGPTWAVGQAAADRSKPSSALPVSPNRQHLVQRHQADLQHWQRAWVPDAPTSPSSRLQSRQPRQSSQRFRPPRSRRSWVSKGGWVITLGGRLLGVGHSANRLVLLARARGLALHGGTQASELLREL